MALMVGEKRTVTPKSPSVGEILVWATALLKSSGVDTARLDAECLLASLLGCDRLHLYATTPAMVPRHLFDRYRTLIARRQSREPLAYLTGTKEFWSLSLQVSPAVLIPRPETEIVVQAALTRLETVQAPVVADVGTGSGAIAVAIAKTRPDARIFAAEISTTALEVARENASIHRVSNRIVFLQGDLLEPILGHGLSGRCTLIVSNPPYVATAELTTLPPEVRYEPLDALDGGRDGLAFHRRIIGKAAAMLRPGGWLVLEMAPGQGRSLARSLQEARVFTDVAVTPDFGGRPRVISARYTRDRCGS